MVLLVSAVDIGDICDVGVPPYLTMRARVPPVAVGTVELLDWFSVKLLRWPQKPMDYGVFRVRNDASSYCVNVWPVGRVRSGAVLAVVDQRSDLYVGAYDVDAGRWLDDDAVSELDRKDRGR